MVQQRAAGRSISLPGVADVCAELFGKSQRREAGTAKRNQERSRIVVIGTRSLDEIAVVHRDLDPSCMRLGPHAEGRNGQRGQQSNKQDQRRIARSSIDSDHGEGVFAT